MFRNGYPRLRQEPVGEGLVGRDRPRGPFDKRGLLTKDPRYRPASRNSKIGGARSSLSESSRRSAPSSCAALRQRSWVTPSWRLPQFRAVLAIAPPAPEPVLDAERPDQIESSSDYMQPLATHPRASLSSALQRSPPSPTVARLQNGMPTEVMRAQALPTRPPSRVGGDSSRLHSIQAEKRLCRLGGGQANLRRAICLVRA